MDSGKMEEWAVGLKKKKYSMGTQNFNQKNTSDVYAC